MKRYEAKLVALVMMVFPAVSVPAQGSVAGRVTILERDEPTGDLGHAVIYLEPVVPGRGDARRGAAAEDHDHHREKLAADSIQAEVALQGRAFIPRVRVVRTGGRVEFPNRDSFDHNVFTRSALGDFDLGLFGRGETKTAPFRKTGVYPIYCNIHARMVAYVLALETPHHAQPGVDGRFQIPNVPAGTYRLVAWHERAAQVTREIVVPAAGLDGANVQLDARGYKRQAHKNKFGKDYKKGRDRY